MLSSDDERNFHYIFGFGSIINVATHAPWISSSNNFGHDSTSLPGRPAVLSSRMGYLRGWNFRSSTGFTALGIRRSTENASDINGVFFRVHHTMLKDFDRREVGYDRVQIPFDCIDFPSPMNQSLADCEYIDDIPPRDAKFWIYVPLECMEADEDHPILQSYVDTVLQGCLFWGGEEMAEAFVQTTTDWSVYFLNDTPSSRRPWLYRQQYTVIDKILQRNNALTHFSDRRHPEEFASAFLMKSLRGAWSIPRRNTVFTGRDRELGQIHARLSAQRQNGLSCTVAKLEVAGMGGVGKTQLCIEYCYRYFPSYYGLVIWLQATSAESVAAGYRQLMADTCGGSFAALQEKDTDEVVAQVKARLYASTVPWLLVFDNLEDHSLLDKFVPNGGSAGHVLVTTRLVRSESIEFVDEGSQTMLLGCFDPQESVELLCRAGGSRNVCAESSKHVEAASKLAEHLGHLPLALGMAAAYMRKCDVDCYEYLVRYYDAKTSVSERNRLLHLGHEAVSSSLSLSLEAIKRENSTAWEALRLLVWMGPDKITKKLLRELFSAKNARDKEDIRREAELNKIRNGTSQSLSRVLPGLVGALAIYFLQDMARKPGPASNRRNVCLALSGSVIVLSAIAASFLECAVMPNEGFVEDGLSSTIHRRGSGIAADIYEKTDTTWTILKSFSLLIVKEGDGSIHRLLAQALRLNQSAQQRQYCLDICLHAVLTSWKFRADDTKTWQDSVLFLEHAKAVVSHAVDMHAWSLDTARLSREVGVLSAMALNRFGEAQAALEQSLKVLNGLEQTGRTAAAELTASRSLTLHELGKILRYEGNLREAEDVLKKALEIRKHAAIRNTALRHDIADSLHELGILATRKHSLDDAADFLQQSLNLRRLLELESPGKGIEAQSASTLYQLATVYVARKPPRLDEAESFLAEALSVDMQIGQRAATLKQLARIAIRRGNLDIAEQRLAQALELYLELYGENTPHINIAAVKFQQGILALQQEEYNDAWDHFSDCLRTRRIIYSYSQGTHIEISSTQHQLARVAFAQNRVDVASEMLQAEKSVLDKLYNATSERERLVQALLTNLTWLRKCAKVAGDEDEVSKWTMARADLKRREKAESSAKCSGRFVNSDVARGLHEEALRCRLVARQFALAKPSDRQHLLGELEISHLCLGSEIEESPVSSLKRATVEFYQMISFALSKGDNTAQINATILKACDCLRDRLREHGVEVNDSVQQQLSPPTTPMRKW